MNRNVLMRMFQYVFRVCVICDVTSPMYTMMFSFPEAIDFARLRFIFARFIRVDMLSRTGVWRKAA